MIEAKMTADARNAIIKTGDYLSAVPSAQLAKWKQDGAIFTVNQNGIELVPGWALDQTNKYRPFKSVGEVIKVFGNFKDNWSLAYWFASANSFLGGARPCDLIAQAPEKIIAAAKDAVADFGGVSHG
jgi:hypothetical protein